MQIQSMVKKKRRERTEAALEGVGMEADWKWT